jgi:alkylation response protein AidB-like acyl-CoA dehydrogenase
MRGYTFSPEQEVLRDSIREFVKRKCPDHALEEWDRRGEYPADVVRDMVGLGWLSPPFAEEHGGSGDLATMCLIAEELGRAGYDLAVSLGITMFCGLNVERHGTPAQCARYLEPALEGARRFAIAITEPDAGSDAASVTTRARRDAGNWVLSGQKIFTSGAHIPGTTLLVLARTDPAAAKRRGLSVLLVPNDADGVVIRPLPSLGRRMLAPNTVFFDEVTVTGDDVLGAVNGGWGVIQSGLLVERLYVSAAYVGSAQALLDAALRHASVRTQFGQPLADFQAVGHLLADMQVQVQAARCLVYYAAAQVEQNGDGAMSVISQAKLFGSEALLTVARSAMQILGGYGYVGEGPVQRHFRDAQAATITAGTSQIHRSIIARSLQKGVGR